MSVFLKILEALGVVALCWLPVLIVALLWVARITRPEPQK